jgi:hypothetical protein
LFFLFVNSKSILTAKKSEIKFSLLNIFQCPYENSAMDSHWRNALSLFFSIITEVNWSTLEQARQEEFSRI